MVTPRNYNMLMIESREYMRNSKQLATRSSLPLYPLKMENLRVTTLFFLFFSALLILQVNAKDDVQNQPQENPSSLSKILTDTISLLKTSQETSWEKIKTVIHEMRKQFSPSSLEGVGETETELGTGGVKGTINDAITKNLEKSKETVVESAKSAANVAKEAVHNTGEKDSDAEL
ncbi:uncharacterized protein LOC130957385 [Arachis stenosperma]|nr:uncharacterized protein LOC130957385 [Arachis stenosperma]